MKYRLILISILAALGILVSATPAPSQVFLQCVSDTDGIDTDGNGDPNDDNVCRHITAGDGLADIAMVFSAGNSGSTPATALSPASDPGAFSVGAVDGENQIALFSSRGPGPCDGQTFPDVVAPGVAVKTAGLTFGVFLDAVQFGSGTSFAASHVAGGIALLREAFPLAGIDTIEQALQITAVDLGLTGADNNYGHGFIDLPAAYSWLKNQLSPGDLDHDGEVGISDLSILAADWLRTDCSPISTCRADIDGDGVVDMKDYCAFISDFHGN